MKILVAYASEHGATREIAEHIGRALGDAGLDVDVRDADDVNDVAPYDAAVIGSAVYMRPWRGRAQSTGAAGGAGRGGWSRATGRSPPSATSGSSAAARSASRPPKTTRR